MVCGSSGSIRPWRFFQSLALTPAARTAIRTWPGPGCGSGRSTISRTSGPPNRLNWTAFNRCSDRSEPGTSRRSGMDREMTAAPEPVAAGLQVVDDRALEHGTARQLVERRGQAAEHEPQHLHVAVQPFRLFVRLQLEPPLEPDDVRVLGQVLQQLRVEQPRAARERRVVLLGEVAREERAG